MLNTALELLESGFSVIPLTVKTKLPCKGCSWKEQQETLPDEGLIVSRFEANPGCNLGCITGKVSGFVVIDGDTADACKWIEGNFPDTWLKVKTSKGMHYYFKYPKLKENEHVKTTSCIVHESVDVRGDKGLVVLPPSVHASGAKYEWIISEGFSIENIDELPELPTDIPHLISGKISKRPAQAENQSSANGELKNIAEQCAWMRHCREDAAGLGYQEWMWMLGIAGRCIGGNRKAHLLSEPHKDYSYEDTEKKLHEVLENMGAISCREISGKFQDCFECRNLGKGKNFSPIILSEEERLEEIKLVTANDIKKIKDCYDFGIEMPDNIINPGGLISKGMDALRHANIPDIPQFSFPIVMSVIGRAISGKIAFGNKWPNFFNIKVGGTSTGKTESDRVMQKAIRDSGITKFYGPTDFSSGPGLLRSVADRPKSLINIDEASYIFKRFGKNDQISAGKKQALLELFSSSGGVLHKTYSNPKDSIKIERPCVNIVGNATPTIFEDIQNDDFETGILQRFDFWYYTGRILKREIKYNASNILLDSFVDHIKKLICSKNPFLNSIEEAIGKHFNVLPDEACSKKLQEFSDFTVEQGNLYENNGDIGIASRVFDMSIKYALCHMASDRAVKNIYAKMEISDIEYGIKVATLISDWKIRVLNKLISQGDFHQNCQLFKAAILGAVKAMKRPTGKILVNRRRQLKNLKPREWDEIVKVLKARGEISVDDTTKITAYWLIKQEG